MLKRTSEGTIMILNPGPFSSGGICSESRVSADGSRGMLDSPEVIEALEFYKALMEIAPPGVPNADQVQSSDYFSRGIVAMETGIERLADDHANAKKLAQGLQERFPGCCDPGIVETNLFHVRASAFGMGGQELADYLAREGILVFPGEPTMRLATHRMVTCDDIGQVLQAFDRLRAEQ